MKRKSLTTLFVFIFSLNIFGQKENKNSGETFVDLRDNRTYKTVRIGLQIWTAENIKFRPKNTQKFWCYGDDEKNCEKYGVLYAWEAAIEACPNGWRMPDKNDWETLEKFIRSDGKILLNQNGFNAKLGGFRLDNGRFLLLDNHAFFWSNEVDTAFSEQAEKFGRYFGRHLYSDKTALKFESSRGKADAARSLRCVQN